MNPSSENDARSLHGTAVTRHWPGMALALAGEALARHGTHGMARHWPGPQWHWPGMAWHWRGMVWHWTP